MNHEQLVQAMLSHTATHSGHDATRSYIGLSHIADCDLELYRAYCRTQAGQPAAPPNGLSLAMIQISYELEAALRARLTALGIYNPGRTLSLYAGLIQGHTDGETRDGDLLEIKTVALERYFPGDDRLPRRISWQVNAYLRYGGFRQAHVIYLARDTGAIHIITVREHLRISEEIAAKCARLYRAVETHTPPACICGHCPAPEAA